MEDRIKLTAESMVKQMLNYEGKCNAIDHFIITRMKTKQGD